LIATDLDGTLVGHDWMISPRSAKALAAAAAMGITVVLVTGRPLRWLRKAYDELAAEYPTICANGAVTYDPETDAVLASHPLAPPVLAEVCTDLATAVPGIAFAAEIDNGRRMVHEPGYQVRFESATHPVPLAELVARPAVKLLGRDDRDPDELAALARAAVGDKVEATHSSTTGLIEMSAPGVTKAAALASFAARLDIPAAEVLAFGDMPNDVTMLGWAGRSVAVANAHPEARAAAGETTLSNLDDGVAVYLERLLDLRG
jgi:Cof subfamily protein (haloacid dehalogenase superfamily)